jgi:hypothetical protein
VDGWIVTENSGSVSVLQHWNGSSWEDKSIFTVNRDLYAVGCADTDNCYAVGQDSGSADTVLYFDGSLWTTQPVTGSTGRVLRSVSVVDATHAVAVGDNGETVRKNGTNWALMTNSSTRNLTGVSCVSINQCFAVGDRISASAPYVTQSNSSAVWSALSLTISGAENLNGIYCNSANDCWAVGDAGFILHNVNGTWSRVTVPSETSNLNAVTCAGANNCWIVGAGSTVLHWNGVSWGQITTTGLAAGLTYNAVSAVAPSINRITAWQELFT